MLGYLAARVIPGVEHVEAGTYRRTVVVDGDPGVLEVSLGGPDHLLLVAHLPHWEGLIHLVQRVRRMFGLDVDLAPAIEQLGACPTIGPLVVASPGRRPPGTWDPFETAVRTVCGQRISVAAAGAVVDRIVERHGSDVAGLGALGLWRTFPTAAKLAGADLGGLGLTAAREEALGSLARAVADGELSLTRAQPLPEFVSALTARPGIGPWSAHYLALRIGYLDAFPAEDLGLRRALEAIWSQPVSADELTHLAEAWSPWRAVAATHLWFSGRCPVPRLASPEPLP
jgi:AraC family transcriptional regulator of adaptative response / DNA-3-methyladenine glycosylase II